MATELGWRPANEAVGGFEPVNDENPLPIANMRLSPFLNGAILVAPRPFSFPLAGSVSMLIKNAQGFLVSVAAYNFNTAVRYLQVFDLNRAPASGDVPRMSFPIAAGSAVAPEKVELGDMILSKDGLYCAQGIALGISTAAATYTAATATDHMVAGLAL